MERLDYRPVDVEAVTREALAYLGRFGEVLGQGSIEQRKEFLRGFVKEIRIVPDKGTGVINNLRLPVSSLMMVPEAGFEPACLLGATPSRWCVCQFHHSGTSRPTTPAALREGPPRSPV